ncbi:TPA: hypothetical protein ACXH4S_001687 [Neisseria meningitidis]|uniref:hypothetical protein n=1 Tax=Neisseria TaxID=482 RepID=UPI000318360F|nr:MULTISPECIES: hypothetical protein [Neisseria]
MDNVAGSNKKKDGFGRRCGSRGEGILTQGAAAACGTFRRAAMQIKITCICIYKQ